MAITIHTTERSVMARTVRISYSPPFNMCNPKATKTISVATASNNDNKADRRLFIHSAMAVMI